ncbi:hypothetical protein [Bacterioplanoides sp.]|uniref:hypothetical protein n=1 Tax=Bacterioplanoides sp. TaxID=2066072 RepID=UPI003B5C8A47
MFRTLFAKGVCFLLSAFLISGAAAQTSREFRADHTVGVDLGLSLVSLPFPGSKGAAVNFNLSDQWQLGLSYMNSGFEVNFSKLKLAGFKERHAGLVLRRFFGNSFNLSGAYVYRSNEVFLDPEIYNIPVTDQGFRTEAETHMAQLGISNHWQFDNWSMAVDWITLTLPLSGEVTQSVQERVSEGDRDTVRRAENVLTWYPNLALATLRVGYMF